jgi:predicted PurR-regulated permease PerM
MNISTKTIIKVLLVSSAFFGLIYLGYVARRELSWIGISFFFALAFNPVVSYVSKYMPRKNRGLAIGVVLATAIAIIAFLVASFTPPLVSQSQNLAENLPKYTDQVLNGHSWYSNIIRDNNLIDKIKESQAQLVAGASSASTQVFGLAQAFFSSIIAFITITFLIFFMLLEGPKWVELFWRNYPEKSRDHAKHLAQQMYQSVTGYVNGNLLTSLVATITASISLALVGVPYAIPLGIVVGITDLIPMVGATIGAILVIAVALFSSLTAAIVMLVFFIVYQQIENHVLQPIVYGKTVQISPLIVLIAVVLGATLGGLIGAIVAIPVAASIQVLVKDAASRRNNRPTPGAKLT